MKLVLVDTSIWISLYRKQTSPIGQILTSLVDQKIVSVCGQIWLEYSGGFKKLSDRERARRFFFLLNYFESTKEDFDLAAELKVKYPMMGYGDLVIAAVAIRNDSALMTLDKDFLKLEPDGLVLFPTVSLLI